MGIKEDKKLRSFFHAICLASAGAVGIPCTSRVVDWDIVVEQLIKHHLIELASCSLQGDLKTDCPQEIQTYFATSLKHSMSLGMIRKQRILHLINEMAEAGLSVLLIKGYAVGNNYACPESRDSADVDILIRKHEEKKACEFMRSKGFIVHPRSRISHHTVCQHKKYGAVEMHVDLHDEHFMSIWREELRGELLIQEAHIRIQLGEYSIGTLGYTDHLIFLILHMAKHFIIGGLTIRMMIDIALFFSKHQQEIDHLRVWATVENLMLQDLLNTVLWIMIHSGCFSKSDFPGILDEDPKQEEAIIRDIQAGGYMGVSEEELRYTTGMEYRRQLLLRKKKRFKYILYMLNWKALSLASSLHMEEAELAEKYPFIKWKSMRRCWHCIVYPLSRIHAGAVSWAMNTNETPLTEESHERLELFQKMKML